MNRRQGLSKSNLVLRIRLAQFCGVEPHVISDPEFHTEEGSCPGMLEERRTVTLWETETFVINTDGKIWLAVSQTHTSSVTLLAGNTRNIR